MLETVIAENTAAVRELIALFKAAGIPLKPTSDAPAETPAPAAAKPKARTEKAAEPAAPPAAAPAAATYEQAAKAVTSLIQRKGKDAAVVVLKQFSAAKLSDVKPERFAEIVAACESA